MLQKVVLGENFTALNVSFKNQVNSSNLNLHCGGPQKEQTEITKLVKLLKLDVKVRKLPLHLQK